MDKGRDVNLLLLSAPKFLIIPLVSSSWKDMADLPPLMQNKRFVVLAILSTLFLISVPFFDALSSADDPTGNASWKKKLKKAWKKSGIEQVDNKVKAEVNRVDDNLKKAGDKIEAEGKRFGKRTNAEWQRFDDRAGNELERFGERVEAEVNRVDENLEKLGDKAKEEYKRFIKRIKEELETQRTVFKNLSRGKACDAYNAAQKSDAYDVKKWIYDTLMPPIKDILRPHVTTLVAQVAAPLNSIPLIGNALYVIAVSPATTEKLTEQAAKKAIREALEECA